MKLSCEEESRCICKKTNSPSPCREVFSPESSLSPSCNTKSTQFNFTFKNNDIQYKDFIAFSFDECDESLFTEAIEIMNESIQISIDIDDDCDELLTILTRKPISTKARTIPSKKKSLVGRVLVNNTQNTMASTQNSTQMNSLVSCSKNK